MRIVLLLLVCICLSLLSCHGNNDPAAPPPAISAPSGSASASVVDTSAGIDLSKQPGTRYQVTYAGNVVRVSADSKEDFHRCEPRPRYLCLYGDAELRSRLTPGKAVLFEGLSFKRIQAIAEEDGKLFVGTGSAPLNELFKDADIRWQTPIKFLEIHNRQVQALSRHNSARTRQPLVPWITSPRVLAAEEGKEEEEEGWPMKFDADFSPDKVDFQVYLTQSGDPLDAAITGNGYVKKLRVDDGAHRE
jgi:hypothetical protein